MVGEFTEREIEVLTCLGEGMSNAQIGRRLHLTEATVKGYVSEHWSNCGTTTVRRQASSPTGPVSSAAGPVSRGSIAARTIDPMVGCLVLSRSARSVSELEELGVRRHDPLLLGAEIDEHGNVFLDADHSAEAVFVVVNLVAQIKLLDGWSGGWGFEGTGGQVAPGHGWGALHQY
jgi:hypothetical protein